MKYAVPRGNRQFACWPGLADLPSLVRENSELKSRYRFDVLGQSALDFAASCRRDMAAAASAYESELGFSACDLSKGPLIATGHQPELFHAGVWVKNFLTARLASSLGGSSFNIIVDNDVPKHVGLVAPAERDGQVRQVELEFADRLPERAFEEYEPTLRGLAGFTTKLLALSRGTPFEDNAGELARRLAEADGVGRSLADVTSSLRISVEREAGITTAEAPISRIAQTQAFGAFAISVLLRAEEMRQAYNDALADYRREHRIRSAANPIPDLGAVGDLIEAPFWVWQAQQPRGRLYVRRSGGAIDLFNGNEQLASLSAGDFAEAGTAWGALAAEGIKIRPRALTTTIFMRLFVSDLFIHGIGGAKYDEVTDRIVRSFYGVEPPPHATASASLMLPWQTAPADKAEVPRLRRKLRDAEYNPQVLLAPESAERFSSLVEEKWRLVALPGDDRRSRREKWQAIRDVNARIAAGLGGLAAETEEELAQLTRRLEADRVLFSREYAVYLVGWKDAVAFYDEKLAALTVKSCP